MPHVPRLLRFRISDFGFRISLLALALAASAQAGAFRASAHGNQALLPRGCGSCHVGHGPPGSPMLPGAVADTCLTCHGDSTARAATTSRGALAKGDAMADIAADARKPSRHPLPSPGQPAPPPARLGAAVQLASSVVTCSSCHDTHYLVKTPAQDVADLTRVKQTGNARHGARPEYETCYRCHGAATRAAGQRDIQSLFRQGNPSFHPVEAIGRNPDVLSLIPPYTPRSFIACTSCHGSDQANGPRGPHGSAFKPILKAHFQPNDGLAESAEQYALCYRCHNRNTLVLNRTSGFFEFHNQHIVDIRASCRTCHNVHGSPRYTHLIDFDTRVVFPNAQGSLTFEDRGVRRGACSLLCHNKEHNLRSY
ncbi:MAG: hypothetical protein FJ291_10255 [Planctomycetes bacterium]|nr:hypothetical protein [Planctomycetota bacterium]